MNINKAKELLRKTKADIAKHGNCVFAIGGHKSEPSYAYTVSDGNLEFIVFGNIQPQAMQAILNTVWAAFKTPSADKPTDLNTSLQWYLDSPPIKLIEVSPFAAGKYMLFCQNVYGKLPKRVIQVLLIDKNGKYPGEIGYDESFPQVVLPTLQ